MSRLLDESLRNTSSQSVLALRAWLECLSNLALSIHGALAIILMGVAWFGGGNSTQITTALVFAWAVASLGLAIADIPKAYILAGIVVMTAIVGAQGVYLRRGLEGDSLKASPQAPNLTLSDIQALSEPPSWMPNGSMTPTPSDRGCAASIPSPTPVIVRLR